MAVLVAQAVHLVTAELAEQQVHLDKETLAHHQVLHLDHLAVVAEPMRLDQMLLVKMAVLVVMAYRTHILALQ
jgi:hypothetical protein